MGECIWCSRDIRHSGNCHMHNKIVWHAPLTDTELEILEEEWGGYFEVVG
jgi:hypothetical protein